MIRAVTPPLSPLPSACRQHIVYGVYREHILYEMRTHSLWDENTFSMRMGDSSPVAAALFVSVCVRMSSVCVFMSSVCVSV